ncbi:hypothetical protein PR048_032748 [Dryococelus australis]|uniref:Uncharacterized protein n=1 Tax=Dryococelus australis TaxID=614101 RepID=A0ABQ9G318_9NEOP|nr:hypothetical protein PR048_032748 [Dryococelus australis]
MQLSDLYCEVCCIPSECRRVPSDETDTRCKQKSGQESDDIRQEFYKRFCKVGSNALPNHHQWEPEFQGHYTPTCRFTRLLAAEEQGLDVGQRLDCSPPTMANRARSPAGPLPDFRKWESYRAMPLVGGFSRRSPVFPVLAFRSHVMSCHPPIGCQDLVITSRPGLSTQLSSSRRPNTTTSDTDRESRRGEIKMAFVGREGGGGEESILPRGEESTHVIPTTRESPSSADPTPRVFTVPQEDCEGGTATRPSPPSTRLINSSCIHHPSLLGEGEGGMTFPPPLHGRNKLSSFSTRASVAISESFPPAVLGLNFYLVGENCLLENSAENQVFFFLLAERSLEGGPGVTRQGIEPGSPWWEASSLTAQPPRPPPNRAYFEFFTRGCKIMTRMTIIHASFAPSFLHAREEDPASSGLLSARSGTAEDFADRAPSLGGGDKTGGWRKGRIPRGDQVTSRGRQFSLEQDLQRPVASVRQSPMNAWGTKFGCKSLGWETDERMRDGRDGLLKYEPMKLDFENVSLPNALCLVYKVHSKKVTYDLRNAGRPQSVRAVRLEEAICQHIDMPSTSTRSIARQMCVPHSTVWDVLWINPRHSYRWQKVQGIQRKYVFKTQFSQAPLSSRDTAVQSERGDRGEFSRPLIAGVPDQTPELTRSKALI